MKVYIISIRDPRATPDLHRAIESCEQLNYPYEIVESILGPRRDDRSKCCTIGHLLAANRIYTSNEPGITIEHDSVMLKQIDFDIEDNTLYNLHGSRAGFGQLMTPAVAEEITNIAFDVDLNCPTTDIYHDSIAKTPNIYKPNFNLVMKPGYVWGDCGNYSIRQEGQLRG